MALRGTLNEISVADLIQYYCQDRKTAQLVITHLQQQADLFFMEGNVVHATSGNLVGEEVIYRILNWVEGDFVLELGVKSPVTTITESWSSLLLEGVRRLDETQEIQEDHLLQEFEMANITTTLDSIMKFDGAIAVALVDWNSGLTLGIAGGSSTFNIELAAAGNTNVVRSKLSVMKDLKLKGQIEDMLISLSDQYHLIRPLSSNPNLFIYVALNRATSNLGLARHKLAELEKDLVV